MGGKQALCHESYQPIPTLQIYIPLLLVEHTSFSFSTGSVQGLLDGTPVVFIYNMGVE